MEIEDLLVVLFGILLRWIVSLYPYSGAGKSPMFGDYEAQRHWQEITINLPVTDWYKNGTDNDLMYWGLDYPPLTAYHSYLCGIIANFISKDYVALHTSRGYESKEHKLFMRYTVLIADLVTFFAASIMLFKVQRNKSMLKYLLLYPGLYLIDYGHFQYNCVSLGLFLFSVTFFLSNKDIIGSIWFCLALNYKQMELYHAVPIFCFLLGSSLQLGVYEGIKKIAKIGIVVILVFFICWLPFLFNIQSFLNVITRIFPVGRGIYEDKVANFWCAVNILIKIKNHFDNSQLALICLLTTLVGIIPSCFHLLFNPTHKNLKYSLVNTSLAFFLFSYHVHEKSILLVAIPVCLISDKEKFAAHWFLSISILSMFPLLIRDGLLLPTLLLSLIMCLFTPKPESKSTILFYYASFLTTLLICIAELIIPPPHRYPDIYPVLLSAYSCLHFLCFYAYFNFCQMYKFMPKKIK